MALSTAKLSEIPFHHGPLPLCSRPSISLLRYRFRLLFSTSASLRLAERGGGGGGDSHARRTPKHRKYPWDDESSAGENPNPRNPPGTHPLRAAPSAPWLQQWTPPDPLHPASPPPSERSPVAVGELSQANAGRGSIERIVHRLRNLGLGLEDDEEVGSSEEPRPLDGSEKLGDLLERSWNRPDLPGPDQAVLPWEREWESGFQGEGEGLKKRRVKAPTLAELTIEDSELRRLRRQGMLLRERMTIPKAGVTQAIVGKIHDAWRKSELVRLKFHEALAHDMKTAHELVERRTGGLVIWRSGSVMVVYRGSNYKRPLRSQSSDLETNSTKLSDEGSTLFIPDVSGAPKLADEKQSISSTAEQARPSLMTPESTESMTGEEADFNQLLDELGPRFVDWWGTGILPVDADLLPQTIPGYKTPFRLLPTGMRSRLPNSEMTNLRKLAKTLPCHFALGRNRHHQGLAAAILKLWEKSLVVKIAVKRGIQNTNNKLMAEELKKLTGGILLLRNKYYIVIYRGKDFLPTSVASALAERQELTRNIQDLEEKARNRMAGVSHADGLEGYALAGTLAEFQEARERWGRNISAEEYEAMKEEASRSEKARLFKKIEHKFHIAEAKKLRAERLLAKIEASMIPVSPSDDQEMITDEERSVFRRIGLRMKAYLPLGIRGVFDGVIENMHLHWKHRELVKLISKQKTPSFVEDTAHLLEYESGGILVAIERVPKGFALIFYRGKNYRRPISLRPRNLLTKAKALKRAVAMQRHEALSQHIIELEKTIEQMKLDLGISEGEERDSNNPQLIQSGSTSCFSEIEEEETYVEPEDVDDSDNDYNDDEGSHFETNISDI
ncbi:CRM-domain containing factor CFM3, chloroplastic/mitochondrial isoform X2 [Phoenix dactylifera]|uniref:CRM-domain containing factor CFM3, chloroplastic/mitochondrial n=1 Tax=Phoenix dactylifera TaxID=42345 RepID=A0A8B7BXW4_PHODC|nr:CRM-domain containing factor CFM3, chloroplastic/mitochondrial isoform X2 [Phoenix dactylifera]